MSTEDGDPDPVMDQIHDEEERFRAMPGAARAICEYWDDYSRSGQFDPCKMDELVDALDEIVGCFT